MKQIVSIFLMFVQTMCLLGSGFYLADNNKNGWGWFVGLGVLSMFLLAGVINQKEKEEESHEMEG